MESKQTIQETNEIVEEFSDLNKKFIQLKMKSYNLGCMSKTSVSKLKSDCLSIFKLITLDPYSKVIVTKKVYLQKIKDSSYTYNFSSTAYSSDSNIPFIPDSIQKVEDYTYSFYTPDDAPYNSYRLKDYQKTWYLFDE